MKSHQRGTPSSLSYGRPVRAVAIARAASSRTCVAPGCTTTLSRYNPVDTCSLHDGWGPPRPRT